MIQSNSEARRHQLVASMREREVMSNPRVAQAFLAVPRELFLSHFYERIGQNWVLHVNDGSEQWLDHVYQDEALATEISHNLPLSSSSQPSIMAQMLEALDVQPGHRVLEIGTGTGYNAALLAALTENPRLVTTIEIDTDFARRAELVLHEQVGRIQVYAGDGRQGVPSQVPYDRIIATASSSSLPRAWYEQLAPGGRLVLPLEGSLQVGGFLIIEKGDQEGRGFFDVTPLHFMSLRSTTEQAILTAHDLFQLPVKGDVHGEQDDSLIASLQDEQFRWFLQWSWPSQGYLQIFRLTRSDGSQALLIQEPIQQAILQLNKLASGSWLGKQHGEFPLWQTIRRLWKQYQKLGQPGKEAFHLRLDGERAALVVIINDQEVFLRDLFS